MDPANQHGAVNMTRAMEALSPYITNARRTVVEIEALVALAAGLMFLQLILGPLRRRSGHWFIQGTLWLAYTLAFPLIAYTLGQMVSSPAKNGLYYVWAVILFWAAGCTNSITAYDIEDNKQWKRYLFELLQYIVYLCVTENLLFTHKTSFSNLLQIEGRIQPIDLAMTALLALLLFTNMVKAFAGWMVTRSFPSKLVADYVSDQVDERGAQDSFDPIRMKGYKYLVRWRVHHPMHHYSTDGIITIDTIWVTEFNDGLLNTSIAVSQLKDVCLSLALSHLLKRRFFGMECAEAALPETHKFVLEGLLSTEGESNNYTRAFHIIEVELGFLYDFFFTKYAALFDMEVSFLVLALLKLISICICGAVLLRDPPIVKTLVPIIEVGTRTVDVTITVMVIGSLFLVELLQAILYLTSDWATVSLACSYTRRGSWDFTTSVIWFLRRFNLYRHLRGTIAWHNIGKFLQRLNILGYWQNKMGQSSVIQGCCFVPDVEPVNIRWIDNLLVMALIHVLSYMVGSIHSMIFPKKLFVVIPDSVKSEIVSCLTKSSIGGPLTNGEAALQRNGVLGEFSWALKDPSQAKVMAIWHVATDYCNIGSHSKAKGCQSSSEEEERERIDYYKQVATTISRYCVYLMSTVPDFLPGNSIDTYIVFDKLKQQSIRVLHAQKPSRDLLLKAIDDAKNSSKEDTGIRDSGSSMLQDTNIDESTANNNQDDSSGNNMQNSTVDESAATNTQDNMFIEGLKLGRDLEKIEDEVLRWKVMAEFWAETIIYIAPSDNVKLHMEHLAQGGEFLTHVWALLTHAGILKRDQKQAPEDNV